MRPLAIDLCAGLGGWTEGLLAEGFDVIGFDIEAHEYGDAKYPAQLVLQDVLTLDGRQFKDRASLIVASPPCQKYSYMAMPWTKSKELAKWYRDTAHPERLVELNAIFNACLRIGAEAECPIVIENVRGAQPWVGRSRAAFGSFHLWGDVPALMPIPRKAIKNDGGSWFAIGSPGQKVTGQNPVYAIVEGMKNPGFRFDGSGRSFQTASVEGIKMRDADGKERDHPNAFGSKIPATSSGSKARKAASAHIAKIPLALSRFIASTYYPRHRKIA